MARYDVKMTMDSIKRAVVGDKGPFDKYEVDESDRLEGATTDFFNAITNVQGGIVTTEYLNKTKADIVKAWGKQADKTIKNLPRPMYWEGNVSSDKQQMRASLQKAIDATEVKQGLGMSPEIYVREMNRLKKYHEQIELLSDPAPTTGK